MAVDRYARAGRGWAAGAMRVYGPLAEALVDMCAQPLRERCVLDAGAGTGAVSTVLTQRGARPVATDMSLGMLAQCSSAGSMRAVSDVCAIPLRDGTVDGSVAAFVLNHLSDPRAGLAELGRVTRDGGPVLATVFSNASRSAARDRLDEVLTDEGWRAPDWYVELKATTVPLLGSAPAMGAVASAAGLRDVRVEERPVDVGITDPEDLVEYRLGQAHFAAWLEEIGARRGAEIRSRAVEAVRAVMEPYRPIVVFLSAAAG